MAPPKPQILKKTIKKKKSDDQKALCLETLNPQKGQNVWSIREIFRSNKCLVRHSIPYKLTYGLNYSYDHDELKRNTELMKKHTISLKNIGHVEATG